MENGAGKMENGAGKTGSAGKLNVQILRHTSFKSTSGDLQLGLSSSNRVWFRILLALRWTCIIPETDSGVTFVCTRLQIMERVARWISQNYPRPTIDPVSPHFLRSDPLTVYARHGSRIVATGYRVHTTSRPPLTSRNSLHASRNSFSSPISKTQPFQVRAWIHNWSNPRKIVRHGHAPGSRVHVQIAGHQVSAERKWIRVLLPSSLRLGLLLKSLILPFPS